MRKEIPSFYLTRLCSRCRSIAYLFHASPSKEGGERRSYECAKCHQVEHYKVHAETDEAWQLIAVTEGESRAS